MLLVKLLTSSNANDSSNASFSYSNSNNSVSNTNANRSFFYISKSLINKIINVIDIDAHNKYFKINFVYKGRSYYTISKNKILYNTIINKQLPTTIKV